MKTNDKNNLFEELFNSLTPEEIIEQKGSQLAMEFLGIVDEVMAKEKISKKSLALQVGTSPSFITQMFLGDRKPSWNMLAKMQDALGIDFKIATKQAWKAEVNEALFTYHKNWSMSQKNKYQNPQENYSSVLASLNDDNEYALAV